MSEKLTHWKKQFNYEYLGAYSLPNGKDIVLTIKETKKEEVVGSSGKKEECFIAYFVEDAKPMVLNRTNCKIITKLYKTPYIEEWSGKQIQIGAKMVDAFGEKVDSLRVRNIVPKTDARSEVKTDTPQWEGILSAVKNGYTLQQVESKYLLTKEQIKIIQNEVTRNKTV